MAYPTGLNKSYPTGLPTGANRYPAVPHPVLGPPAPSAANSARNTLLTLLPGNLGLSNAQGQATTLGVHEVAKRVAGTPNRPNGKSGKGDTTPTNPYAKVPVVTAPIQTPAQILTQLNKLVTQMNAGGSHVPGAISLAHIAAMVKALPTSANMPGKLSLANIQNSLRPSSKTPGFVNPQQAATAAAQQAYGGAVSADQLAVQQQTAQNGQSLSDIQNWYNHLLSLQQGNAASDAAGYNAATQSTGNIGGAVSGALGFDAGSDGANTIGQTGSILNAGARMAAASGEQYDRNLMTTSSLSGVQDYRNQQAQGQQALAGLNDTLNSDLKGKGAAYNTALDAARQANAGNAQSYAGNLLNLNQAYQGNFANSLKAKEGKISTLAGLNSQYNTQNLNHVKTRLAALGEAGAIAALPSQYQAGAAKANSLNAGAYKTYQDAQSNWLKQQTANITAKAKASGQSQTQWLKNSQARFGLGGAIFKTVMQDPKAFKSDPLTGSTTLKSPKQAKADIAAMIMQAGYDPTKGAGALLSETAMAMILGSR